MAECTPVLRDVLIVLLCILTAVMLLCLIRAVRGDYENGLFFCGAGVHRLEGMHSVAWLMKHWKTEWRAFA